jgi:hypothetical protein
LVHSPELLELWPSWSWLSYPGKVEFHRSIYENYIHNLSEEEGIMRVALDNETAQGCLAEHSRFTDKKLCLKGFLIQGLLSRKRNDQYDVRAFVKDEQIGEARLDYESTFPSVKRWLPVFLFSLGQTESEKKTQYLNTDSCAFLGLLLHRHDATSFKRIGTFQLYNTNFAFKRKDSRWIFQNAQRESVTLV